MSLATLMAALLLAVAVAGGGYWQGTKHANVACVASTQTAAATQAAQAITSLTIARRAEHNQQEAVNAALQTQHADLANTRSALDAALERLRQRPERAAVISGASGLPAAARPACAGTTGAELSRPDAEFLVREAARADGQRAALKACYTAIDAERP